MQFSLLMSIYKKENVAYFHRCMQSIWEEQTVKPHEIILVEDGPLTDTLYAGISVWEKRLGDVLKIISLEKNVGLGKALNIGLQACSHTLVARMDTDDIAHPERFEKQLALFENTEIDLCSSWISEFKDTTEKVTAYRKVPETQNAIERYAKKRNPFNHPAVMYRKSSVLKAGGYKEMLWFEDYYLWTRMIQSGAKLYNIQEPLVKMRAGQGQLERRSGWIYAKQEFYFQKILLNEKFLTHTQFIYNVSLRFTSRVIPKRMLRYIYSLLRT